MWHGLGSLPWLYSTGGWAGQEGPRPHMPGALGHSFNFSVPKFLIVPNENINKLPIILNTYFDYISQYILIFPWWPWHFSEHVLFDALCYSCCLQPLLRNLCPHTKVSGAHTLGSLWPFLCILSPLGILPPSQRTPFVALTCCRLGNIMN